MNILLMFIFIFLFFSCVYPDIDSVPEFNLKKSTQEKCGNENQISIVDKEECKIFQIVSRL